MYLRDTTNYERACVIMATLSIENIERVNAEITANEKSGVVAYVFAVQFTPATVSFVKVPTTETRGLAKMLKISGKKIMFKATKEFKNALADYEIIKECPTIEIEKITESDERINRGHAAEMILFGHDIETTLASQDKVDGYFNGEKLQLKASLISWKGTSNNGMGTATFVDA